MEKPEKKAEFSAISIIIAFLLGVALIVFLQFAVKDITRSFYGEKPRQPDFSSQTRGQGYQYQGIYYEDYNDAKTAFEKAELIPYETTALLVNTLINVPLFLLAVGLLLSVGKLKSAYKLITTTFFIAMVVNMFNLLKDLGIYVYKINERLAIYGISLFLIIVFTISVILVQEKIRTKTFTPEA